MSGILLLFAFVFMGCSEENESKVHQQIPPFLLNSTNVQLSKTTSFIKKNISPEGILTFIVVDSISDSYGRKEAADSCFSEIHHQLIEHYKNNTFKYNGLLIYATVNDSLVQLRCGDELKKYLKLKGVIAGSRYMHLQHQAKSLGIDSIIPNITTIAWEEINNMYNRSLLEKIKMGVYLSWFDDILLSIGTPSETLTGTIPSIITKFISKINGKTNSLLYAMIIFMILYWLINYVLDRLFCWAPKADRKTMLIGHDKKLIYFLKLFVNGIIIAPSLGTFFYFSNLRTEDILFLESNNIPYIEMFDWSFVSTSSSPSFLLTILLSIIFYISYLFSPRHLLAYYFSSNKSNKIFLKNKTLIEQCADLSTKGKWDFRLFMGAVFVVLIFELLTLIYNFVIWLFYPVVMFIVYVVGFIAKSELTVPDVPIETASIDTSIPSQPENIIDVDATSNSNTIDINEAVENSTNGVVPQKILKKSSNTDYIPSSSTRKVNTSEGVDHIKNDDENIGKSLAGVAIADAIASKLPKDFLSRPFLYALKKVNREGIMISLALLFVAPMILNESIAIFFIFFYLIKIFTSIISEFVFTLDINRINKQFIIKQKNHSHVLIERKIDKKDKKNRHIDSVYTYLRPMKSAAIGKYGFVDNTGKIIIPFHWDNAGKFFDGFASVQDRRGKWGFIDRIGRVSIPCQWEKVSSFHEGLAWVMNKDNKWGGIDKTGKVKKPFQRLLNYEGLISFFDNNRKYGFIDKTGKVVIPCKWKEVGHFQEGLAYVQDDSGKYGFIDKTGKVVIPCKWKCAGYFQEGLTYVLDDNEKYGFIDKTGKVVIPCKWKNLDQLNSFQEDLTYVLDDNEKYGFIDKTGKDVIPCKWKDVGHFQESLAYVQDDSGKYGFIDKTGKVVIPCKWKYAGYFQEGLAYVLDDNEKYGFIDKTGKVVIPCKWKYAGYFQEGLAYVLDDNEKYGFIDKTGKVVIPCRWRYARSFSEGLARIRDEKGMWGFVDKSGKIIISCKWIDSCDFNKGRTRVQNSNGMWLYIDKSGTIINDK